MSRSFFRNSCFALFALWTAFFPLLSLPAQALYKMKHLGPTDGLSYRWVHDITQDSLGHIWVATSDGLNRYDGHRFAVFRTEVTGTLDPIALNHFKWVFCMEGNDIWVTAMEGTHLHFLAKSSQLQPFATTDRGQPAEARALIDVQTGRWWALVRMKKGEKDWLARVTSPGHFQLIVQLEWLTSIKKYVVPLQGGQRFWAYAEKAYYLFDPIAPSVVVHSYSAIPGALIVHPSLPIDAQRRFWFPAPEGGFRYVVLPAAIPVEQWERFELDNKGNFWIWTRGKHTWRYVRQKDALEDFGVFDFWEYNLHSPFEDREGNIWLPHFYGLTQLVPQRRLFENYLNQPLNDLGVALGGGSFYALWEGDDGFIYVNTNGKEATVRLKSRSSAPEFLPWLPPPLDAVEKAAVERAAARLRLDTLGAWNIFWLYDKENQVLWIGPRQATSIHRIDLRDGEERHFPLSETPLSLKQLGFLNGQLWVASTSGLYRLDPQNGQCRRFSTKDGLPHNIVYSLLTDGPYLWLGTHYGLCRFDTRSGETKNYYVEDGLTHNEFNSSSALKTRAGKMYFGGLNGLNAFFPADIEHAELRDKPRLYLNRLAKFDGQRDTFVEQPCPTDSSGSVLRLHPDDRSFVFDFSINSFYNPSQNKYLYYLDGLEKPWCNETSEGRATYLYLPPGQYVLRVKAAGPFGNRAANEIAVPIEMPYRWYLRWWAWCAYVLIGWFGGRMLYRQRLKRHLDHREALRLRELDEFKSHLFTNITHEFRTPLTVILGVAEHMEQAAPDHPFDDLPSANRFSGGLKKRLALVRRNGHNLLDLVNQLLDLAKAESNQLKISMVQGDLVRYVRYITESFHSVANHHNILLRVESKTPELFMDYDPEKVRQILSNLLSNALKHTPSGGQVKVSIAQEAAAVCLKVEDTGTGIAPDELSRIFDRFYQTDSAAAKAGGTGIGLALTKELVKLLGGRISVESELGKGTAFTVTLPVRNEAAVDAAILVNNLIPTPPGNPTPDPSPKGAGRPDVHHDDSTSFLAVGGDAGGDNNFKLQTSNFKLPSLLLIEDNPDVVEYLQLCLEGLFQLDFAYNGRIGIEKGLDTVPDLILSDVMMPEKDGFAVCDTLKNDERTSHIPIVLLTAKADVESRIAGLRRGADAYLAKPFHPGELVATLQNLLALRQKLQAKYASAAFHLPFETPSNGSNAVSIKVSDPGDRTDLEEQFLQSLRQAVEARLDELEVSLPEVCRAVGMGKSNLYAKLSALTGMSFNVYVRSLRLHKAKYLLESTEMNVSEVAYEVGFKDPKYFSRTFSEEFGIPPSEVRG